MQLSFTQSLRRDSSPSFNHTPTRVIWTHNFENNLPYCDIQIGSDAPVGEWPEFVSGTPIINGYGFVGESLKNIEENDARMLGNTNDAV